VVIPADTGRSTQSAYRQRWIEDDEMVKFSENREVKLEPDCWEEGVTEMNRQAGRQAGQADRQTDNARDDGNDDNPHLRALLICVS
jgi:hypothetical protein